MWSLQKASLKSHSHSFTHLSQRLVCYILSAHSAQVINHDNSQDILVIGVGDNDMKVNPKVIQYMRQKKINLEILPTERACATFNFLNAEGRCVAGAIIPPTVLRISDDDLAATQRKNKEFMKTEDEYLF